MKKQLYCPSCKKGRIIDADIRIESRLFKRESLSKDEPADYYIKCWKCGCEIGIKKVS
jgi:hypothetical protein